MANKTVSDSDIEQLIFCILQEKPDKEFLFQIEPFKWHQIYQRLLNNSVCLIIFPLLKKKDLLGALPQEIKEKWQGFYYYNLKRNILALEQAAEIQNALKGTGIEIILLKGLSLISTVYKNAGSRSFVDIDLLVKKDDFPGLKYKLEDLNYRLQNHHQASLLEHFSCCDRMFFREGFLSLDIHWQVCKIERFEGIVKFNEQQIFQDAVYIEVNNNRMLSLSKEDLFLCLSMHLALMHRFSGFSWAYDLKAIIDYYRKDFDWGLLINKAEKANLTAVLYYILSFNKRLLGAGLPPEILKRIKPSVIKRKLTGLFISQRDILKLNPSSKTGKGYYIGQAFLMDGIFNIIRVFVKMLFPSSEWLLYHYNKGRRGIESEYSYRLWHIFNLTRDL